MLRLWTQPYTGFNLVDVEQGRGLESVANLPAEDVIANRLREKGSGWLQWWQDTTRGLPSQYLFRPPRMLGEIGFDVDGVIVNNDTIVYQERLAILYHAGVFPWLKNRPQLRILEIGGGYGALAY